ncbi:hypothetical protein D3C71_1623600 [compost metagenome]
MHFGQVVAQHDFGLAAHGQGQGGGAHVGIAIAVAADPLSHAQKAGDALAAELLLERCVDLGNLAEKSRFVIGQRVLDFVRHRELGVAQQPRLPQLGHAGAQPGFVGREFPRRQRILGVAEELRTLLYGVAFGEQRGDIAFSIENAFALDFGGMGREHR